MAVRHADRGPEALRIYLDSSALAKLLVAEPGTDAVQSLWIEADEIACVSIGYVEVRAMIARRLPARAAAPARRRLDRYWDEIDAVAIDDDLVGLAARVTDRYRLRALDALHLATAQLIGGPEVVLATWDVELRQAARDAGFATLPV
jgi:hypothetical protein